ncbi:MAG: HD domain-containing protein, partial [Acidobacteria bacterium]|nr:HD domain-containing protein [Acidobacteriota bacterium]
MGLEFHLVLNRQTYWGYSFSWLLSIYDHLSRDETMNWKSRAYIAGIVLVGVILAASVYVQWLPENPDRFVLFAILAALTSFWRFQVPGSSGQLSASFLFVLISAVQLGVTETLAIGICASIGQVFAPYKTTGLDRSMEAMFRLSGAMIAASVTGRVFHLLLPEFDFLHFPMRLAITGGVYFFTATIPFAILGSLTDDASVAKVWRTCSFWAFPYYVVGTGAAGFLWALSTYDDFQASMLVVPSVFLLFRWYELYARSLDTEKRRAEKERAVAESNTSLHLRTIHVLARAIDAKEQATEDQLGRIQVYCIGIAREMRLSEDDRLAVAAASLLHDVGNLAVPEHITSKPGRLTSDEFERIKIHAVVGADMLEGVRFPYPVAPIVRYHHERWDGTGYPDGLSGDAIPVGARILGAVDVFVALTSDRIYRPALSIRQALAYLRDEAGGSFDPRVVEVILDNWERFEAEAKNGAAAEQVSPSQTIISTIAATKEEEHFLNTMSARLLNCNDVPSFFTSLSEKLRGAIPFEAFAFYRRAGDRLIPLAAGGVESPSFQRLRIPVGTGATGLAAEHACLKFNVDPVEELGSLTTLRSAISAPVIGADGCVGVLTLYSRRPNRYTKDDGRILTAVAGRLS